MVGSSFGLGASRARERDGKRDREPESKSESDWECVKGVASDCLRKSSFWVSYECAGKLGKGRGWIEVQS